MRVSTAAGTGDLAHLSNEPRRRTDWSAFAGLSLGRFDTLARSATGSALDTAEEEERSSARFDHDAERLRKSLRGRVRSQGER